MWMACMHCSCVCVVHCLPYSIPSPATDSNNMKMLSNAKNENKCSGARDEHMQKERLLAAKLSFGQKDMKINVLVRLSGVRCMFSLLILSFFSCGCPFVLFFLSLSVMQPRGDLILTRQIHPFSQADPVSRSFSLSLFQTRLLSIF